jgi:hypothetical protein
MAKKIKCIGVDAATPCKQEATAPLVIPACPDHRAALYYRVKQAGFDFTGEQVVEGKVSKMDRQVYDEVARDIAAAVLASRLGVTHRTARKYVRDDQDVSDFWIRTARDISNALDDDMDRAMGCDK